MSKKLLFILIALVYAGSLFAQAQWSYVTKMPYPVSGGQAVLYKDKIYILGGYSDSLQTSVNWIQQYDPSSNTWSMIGNMLQPREKFVAAVWRDSSMVFFGGVKQSSNEKENLIYWDFKSGGQPSVFSMDPNFGRTFSTGHVKGDYLYIVGGNPFQPDRILPYILEYDLTVKAISYTLDTLYSTVEKPQQQMSMIINNDLYIMGGVYIGVMKSIQKFNISSKKYETMSSELLEPRAGGAAIYNKVIDQAFVLGGYNEAHAALSSVEQVRVRVGGALDVVQFYSLKYARKNPTVVNYKNSIFVFGGVGADGKVVPFVESYSVPVSVADPESIPTESELFSNYPNPFNPSTTVKFKLGENSRVSLDVYSVLGQHIATIEKGDLSRGYYEYKWDGKDNSGKLVATGVYLLTLRTQNFIQTRKMLLLK